MPRLMFIAGIVGTGGKVERVATPQRVVSEGGKYARLARGYVWLRFHAA
jgi:hypothetical protein